VKQARARLFGSWEMNWMAYNFAHDVVEEATQYLTLRVLLAIENLRIADGSIMPRVTTGMAR
jgi:choline dehydrogenase-like flavoprotein